MRQFLALFDVKTLKIYSTFVNFNRDDANLFFEHRGPHAAD